MDYNIISLLFRSLRVLTSNPIEINKSNCIEYREYSQHIALSCGTRDCGKLYCRKYNMCKIECPFKLIILGYFLKRRYRKDDQRLRTI